jgi:hypothetical protein
MRRLLIGGFTLLPVLLRAQWAIGIAAGIDEDRTWTRSLPRAAARVEYALSEGAQARMRIALSHQPARTFRSERSWTSAQGPLHSIDIERLERTGASIGMKWPLGCAPCPRGLYRGLYLTAQLEGWRRSRWTRHMLNDVVTMADAQVTYRVGAGVGAGGEWNLTWGCPFVELSMAAAVGQDDPHDTVIFPSAVSVLAGFRYCFRGRGAPVRHRHV